MNFYFESIKNELDIESMDCDIVVDRADLTLEYYTNLSNLYTESGNDLDEDWFTEAGNKIGEGIKKAIDSIVAFIQRCADKVRELITGKKIDRLKERYEKALKEHPEMANGTVEYRDYSNIVNACDTGIKAVDGSSDKAGTFDKHNETIKGMKPGVKKAVKFTACIGGIAALGAVVYKVAKTAAEDARSEAQIDTQKHNERVLQKQKEDSTLRGEFDKEYGKKQEGRDLKKKYEEAFEKINSDKKSDSRAIETNIDRLHEHVNNYKIYKMKLNKAKTEAEMAEIWDRIHAAEEYLNSWLSKEDDSVDDSESGTTVSKWDDSDRMKTVKEKNKEEHAQQKQQRTAEKVQQREQRNAEKVQKGVDRRMQKKYGTK